MEHALVKLIETGERKQNAQKKLENLLDEKGEQHKWEEREKERKNTWQEVTSTAFDWNGQVTE